MVVQNPLLNALFGSCCTVYDRPLCLEIGMELTNYNVKNRK